MKRLRFAGSWKISRRGSFAWFLVWHSIIIFLLSSLPSQRSSVCDAWTTTARTPRQLSSVSRRNGRSHWLFRSATEEEQGEEATSLTPVVVASSTSAAQETSPAPTTTTTTTTAPPLLSLLDAAASMTQEACPLLGVKSLGVDYGLVRTGLALTVGYDPIPLAILQEADLSKPWNTTVVCAKVMEYATSQQVHRIIVGLPLHKNGTIAEQTNLTLAFGYELTAAALQTLGPSVPVHFFDERYTSKEAAARAHSRNPGENLQGTLDADAACIILENYYEDNGVGAHELQLPEEVRKRCLHHFERRRQERDQQRRKVQEEREARIQRRKEAIARALEEDRTSGTITDGGRKGKKKKKKRRK